MNEWKREIICERSTFFKQNHLILCVHKNNWRFESKFSLKLCTNFNISMAFSHKSPFQIHFSRHFWIILLWSYIFSLVFSSTFYDKNLNFTIYSRLLTYFFHIKCSRCYFWWIFWLVLFVFVTIKQNLNAKYRIRSFLCPFLHV